MQNFKQPAILILFFGVILLIISSLLPWLDIPEKVANNFETGSFDTLLNLVKGGAVLMGLIGIIGTVLFVKKQKRGYAVIGLITGIVALAGMIIFVASMSASVRRLLGIEITMFYYLGIVGAVILVLGSIVKILKK